MKRLRDVALLLLTTALVLAGGVSPSQALAEGYGNKTIDDLVLITDDLLSTVGEVPVDQDGPGLTDVDPVIFENASCRTCRKSNTCGTCWDCCCDTSLWLRADYLAWWTNGTELPPLVTMADTGTALADAGQLDQSSTTILYGGNTVNDDVRNGWRLSGGYWVADCLFAIGGDYFSLGSNSTGYSATGTAGDPILARPFYNTQTGEEDAELVSFPGVIDGTVSVNHQDQFQSAGGWVLAPLCCCDWCDCCVPGGYTVNFIGGYRHYRLEDSLTIREDLTTTDGSNTTFDLYDRFSTDNEFHGGELGFEAEVFRGKWSLSLLTKVALGNNHQVMVIDGQTITTVGTANPVTSAGGLLATQTNIGRYEKDRFTAIPQIGLELGYCLTDSVRLYTGYNLIYWPSVVREPT